MSVLPWARGPCSKNDRFRYSGARLTRAAIPEVVQLRWLDFLPRGRCLGRVVELLRESEAALDEEQGLAI